MAFWNRQAEVRTSLPTEIRNPKGATLTTRWQTPGMPMPSEWNGEGAVNQAYLSNVVVFACARMKAADIAACPFRVGPSLDYRQDYDENAPLAQLLGPPPRGANPVTAASDLWAWSIIQQEIQGKFGWEIEWNGDQVAALWPLVAQYLQPKPTIGRSAKYFDGFRYDINNDVVNYTNDEVFYYWNPSQKDFRQPESWLQSARLDVSVAVMQDRYDYAFLNNDARPATIMVMEAFAEAEEKRAFEQELDGRYGGPDNAGRTMVVEADKEGTPPADALAIHTLGISQKDADFFRRYEQKVRGISIAAGVPFSKLDASGRTFDNAAQEEQTYWVNTLLPLMRRIENAVNVQLAPKFGNMVGWFDTSHIEALQPAKKYSAVSLSDAYTKKIITKDEAREVLGQKPVEDGSGKEFAADPAPAVLYSPNQPAGEETPPVEASAAPDESRALSPEEMELRRVKIWNKSDTHVQALETVWERAFNSLFEKQEAATIKRLEGKRGRQALNQRQVDPSAIFDYEFWHDETAVRAKDLYTEVFALSGGEVAGAFGVAFDLKAPYVKDFIRARSNKLAGQVTDTTYDRIQKTLIAGVDKGESIDDLAARVREAFSSSTTRSEMIARTEVISSYNGAAVTTAAQLPEDVAAGQEWISTRDERTREAHSDPEVDGQVVALGDLFEVDGEELAYPGDPNGSPENVINCRCTVAILTPEDMQSRSVRDKNVRSVASVERELLRIHLEKRAA